MVGYLENIIQNIHPWLLVTSGFSLAILVIWLIVPLLTKLVQCLKKPKAIPFHKAPSVSILVPAYNEEAVILDSVQSLMALEYDNYEVIVVNDASTDNSMALMKRTWGLELDTTTRPERSLSTTKIKGLYRSPMFPRLLVIDKKRSGQGKADALNVALGYARNKLVCTMDADSVLDPDSLAKIARPFVEHPETVAVSGGVRAGNGSRVRELNQHKPRFMKSALIVNQALEYMNIYYVLKLMQRHLNGIYCVAGVFGLFSKKALVDVGGYRVGTATEDIDLTMRLHVHHKANKIPYRITHVEEATCWTEVPYTNRLFYNQRLRWQSGAVQVLLKHKNVLFNPRYGWVGFFIMPSLMLSVAGPVIGVSMLALMTYLAASYQPWLVATLFLFGQAVAFLPVMMGWIMVGLYSKRWNVGQGAYSLGVAVFTNFFYNMALLAITSIGLYKVLLSNSSISWGEMTRAGFRQQELPPLAVKVANGRGPVRA